MKKHRDVVKNYKITGSLASDLHTYKEEKRKERVTIHILRCVFTFLCLVSGFSQFLKAHQFSHFPLATRHSHPSSKAVPTPRIGTSQAGFRKGP
jgi:hypothetical protein